jgi:uncharacterized surface protein with fasciclin (FAS1) repeats
MSKLLHVYIGQHLDNGGSLKKLTGAVVLATAVLMTPALLSAQHGHKAKESGMKNIVEVAVEAGTFNTLVAAVKAAGLVETLSGDGPFTVFAPSDAAFAKLPKGTVEALLRDKKKLTALLTYHVVPGKVLAADIVKANGATPETINGQSLNIVVRNGGVYVDDAQVTTANVEASNGVIHVVNAVLLPKKAAAVGY